MSINGIKFDPADLDLMLDVAATCTHMAMCEPCRDKAAIDPKKQADVDKVFAVINQRTLVKITVGDWSAGASFAVAWLEGFALMHRMGMPGTREAMAVVAAKEAALDAEVLRAEIIPGKPRKPYKPH